MTVTDIDRNLDALTLTVTSEFTAPVGRVRQMWENPRLLERWWGPPSHPATMVEHELVAGGRVHYFMTAADGDRYHGWWRILAVDEPRRLELEDGFADAAAMEQVIEMGVEEGMTAALNQIDALLTADVDSE